MARDMRGFTSRFAQVCFEIGHHRLDDLGAGLDRILCAEETPVCIGQQPGIVLRSASDHDTVDPGQMRFRLIECFDASVDDDLQVGKFMFQPVNALVL